MHFYVLASMGTHGVGREQKAIRFDVVDLCLVPPLSNLSSSMLDIRLSGMLHVESNISDVNRMHHLAQWQLK